MLDVISQSGTQKMQILHYFVQQTPVQRSEEDKDKPITPEEVSFSIYSVIVNLDTIEMARYKEEATARLVFETMAKFEKEGRFFRLPLDTKESVEASLKGELFAK